MMLGLERCHAQLTDPGCAHEPKDVEMLDRAVNETRRKVPGVEVLFQ